MKKIAIIYGGPDDENNQYGDRVKEILEKIDSEKYELVQIFMTRDSSFKIFNKKHTSKKMFISLNKIFKFLNDQNIKSAMLMLSGAYGESKVFDTKLIENNIEIININNLENLFVKSDNSRASIIPLN